MYSSDRLVSAGLATSEMLHITATYGQTMVIGVAIWQLPSLLGSER